MSKTTYNIISIIFVIGAFWYVRNQTEELFDDIEDGIPWQFQETLALKSDTSKKLLISGGSLTLMGEESIMLSAMGDECEIRSVNYELIQVKLREPGGSYCQGSLEGNNDEQLIINLSGSASQCSEFSGIWIIPPDEDEAIEKKTKKKTPRKTPKKVKTEAKDMR